MAHIIPRSVGGRTFTLACGTCDNRIGSEYDKHRDLEKKYIDGKEKNNGKYGHIKFEKRMIGAVFSGSLFGDNEDVGLAIKPPKIFHWIIGKNASKKLYLQKNY